MKLLSLVLLLLTFQANAADWIAVQVGTGSDQYFYDRSKIFVGGDEITYWKKAIFRQPQPAKGQFATSGLYRERINCAEHTLKLISYLLYAADNSLIEYVANQEGDASPIIPDSLGDLFEKKVCAIVFQRQEEQRIKRTEEDKRKMEESLKKAEESAKKEAAQREIDAAKPHTDKPLKNGSLPADKKPISIEVVPVTPNAAPADPAKQNR